MLNLQFYQAIFISKVYPIKYYKTVGLKYRYSLGVHICHTKVQNKTRQML
jgi:hypothetical protein